MRAGFFGVRRRVVFRRWLAALTGGSLAAGGLLLVPVAPVSAAPASCPGSAADVRSAVAAAKRCGSRVEVLTGRSETRQVFANPDGSSTVEDSVVPARVRRKDGSWADVDLGLAAVPGGWAPRASTVDVMFSDGGTGPFATYRSNGQTVTLSWPLGVLPAPVVSGASLRYPSVLSGVDLWVTVSATGFRPVLEVADAKAAANPALRSLAFTVGGTVHAVGLADGRVRFADAADKTVAVTDPATMWDATTSADAGTGTAKASGAAGAAGSGAAAPDELTSSAEHAGDYARTARVGVSTSGHDLTVRPDVSMLTSASTRWPLFVDPFISSPSQNRFAYADSCNANNDTTMARVGLSPNDGCRYRSYFTIPNTDGTNSWVGKQVLSAEFDAELYHSWSCSDSPAWAYQTNGISSSPRMPWSGSGSAPMPAAAGVSASGHADKDGGCSNSPQPDMLMRFSGSALTSQVQTASSQYWGSYTVGLCACNPSGGSESTQSYWKKFYIDYRAKLIVTYDTVPGTPANLNTSGVACGSTLGVLTPSLKAQAVDADGGDTLSATFHWQQLPSGTVNTSTVGSIPANNTTHLDLSLGSGADGHQFQWQVQTTDASGYPSPWSAWCTFSIDVAAPPTPTVAPSGTPSYGACDPGSIGSCTATGGPGVPGSFTLGPNGAANTTSYTYGWTNPPTTTVSVPAGTSTTVAATPPRYGLNTLYVSSSNGTKSSPIKVYQFLVAAPSAAVANWPLDNINGHNFTDQVSQTALTVGSGVSWTPDTRYVGANAANFNGVSATGNASTTVAALDTSKSFSVAAWVRQPSFPAGNKTAVAQDAGGTGDDSNFYLGSRYIGSPSTPHWSFLMMNTPLLANGGVPVSAPNTLGSADAGKWTHLAGVYDAAAKTISLYVNGVLAASTPFTATAWKATGPLTIGRAEWNAGPTDGFPGQIADVKLWNRAITTDDLWGTDANPAAGVPAMPGILSPTQVASWDFADTAGCQCGGPSVDGAFFGRNLFLDPGWAGSPATSAFTVDGHNGNGGYQGNGNNSYAATTDPDDGVPHPVLRTDQSFTVSAWVNLSTLAAANRTVVGQDGAVNSAFLLQYQYTAHQEPGWGFLLPGSDTMDPTGHLAYASGATTGWTQLVGVYDAGAGTAKLYVNGRLASTVTGATSYQSTGSLTVGRALWDAHLSDSVAGEIDQVQAWQGVRSDREVSDDYFLGRPPGASDRLEPGQYLIAQDQPLRSPDGRTTLALGTDGNLVLARNYATLWSTHTTTGTKLYNQGDGNLVLYDANGTALWDSGTWSQGRPGRLIVQNDGNLVLYDATSGADTWSSGTGALRSEQVMQSSDPPLFSPDRHFRLVVQTDGNVVLYRSDSVARWSTGTTGSVTLINQTDGNVVVYQPDDIPVWSTDTWRQGTASTLVVQNDGNIVLRRDNDSVITWTSNTFG